MIKNSSLASCHDARRVDRVRAACWSPASSSCRSKFIDVGADPVTVTSANSLSGVAVDLNTIDVYNDHKSDLKDVVDLALLGNLTNLDSAPVSPSKSGWCGTPARCSPPTRPFARPASRVGPGHGRGERLQEHRLGRIRRAVHGSQAADRRDQGRRPVRPVRARQQRLPLPHHEGRAHDGDFRRRSNAASSDRNDERRGSREPRRFVWVKGDRGPRSPRGIVVRLRPTRRTELDRGGGDR